LHARAVGRSGRSLRRNISKTHIVKFPTDGKRVTLVETRERCPKNRPNNGVDRVCIHCNILPFNCQSLCELPGRLGTWRHQIVAEHPGAENAKSYEMEPGFGKQREARTRASNPRSRWSSTRTLVPLSDAPEEDRFGTLGDTPSTGWQTTGNRRHRRKRPARGFQARGVDVETET